MSVCFVIPPHQASIELTSLGKQIQRTSPSTDPHSLCKSNTEGVDTLDITTHFCATKLFSSKLPLLYDYNT